MQQKTRGPYKTAITIAALCALIKKPMLDGSPYFAWGPGFSSGSDPDTSTFLQVWHLLRVQKEECVDEQSVFGGGALLVLIQPFLILVVVV